MNTSIGQHRIFTKVINRLPNRLPNEPDMLPKANDAKYSIPGLRKPEMTFKAGCNYTRGEIHAQLGGSVVSCLPTCNGVIVAACLSQKFSPQAPDVVLCGKGARTSPVSALFAAQTTALPVFIKSSAGSWQYRGQFRVVASYTAGAQFERWISASRRSVASVSCVVVLKPSE